ncbi:MAG: S41 family peptidase [Planctomycetota bacterium]
MPKRNVILLVATCLVGLVSLVARERSGHAQRFGEVLGAIERDYFQHVDGDTLFVAAVEAAVATLDENSAYLQDAGRDELESALDQRFGGIGLELALDPVTAHPIVVAPVFGSPAWRAGITAGDLVTAIDGEPTQGRPLRDSVQQLRGPVGERVALSVLPVKQPAETLDPSAPRPLVAAREVSLVRELVEVESVQGDRRRADGSWEWMLEGEPGVAYLRISSFGERTAQEVAAAIAAIAGEAGVRGLVLDLRDNPGGLLQAAVEVCDLFLDEGAIVAMRGRDAGAEGGDERRATAGEALAGVPVAVLVDGLSASAAEIVAACLQDAGRAKVVGGRTFGKGTVQTLLPLADGRGLLKLTTAEYLRPSREPIHRRPGAGDDEAWGVMPEDGFEVTPTAEAVERLRDWRHRRETALPPGASAAARGPLPREIDAVLAKALDAFAEAE